MPVDVLVLGTGAVSAASIAGLVSVSLKTLRTSTRRVGGDLDPHATSSACVSHVVPVCVASAFATSCLGAFVASEFWLQDFSGLKATSCAVAVAAPALVCAGMRLDASVDEARFRAEERAFADMHRAAEVLNGDDESARAQLLERTALPPEVVVANEEAIGRAVSANAALAHRVADQMSDWSMFAKIKGIEKRTGWWGGVPGESRRLLERGAAGEVRDAAFRFLVKAAASAVKRVSK